jgi:hypothetical protein
MPNLPKFFGPSSVNNLLSINLKEVATSDPGCLVVEPMAVTIPFNSSEDNPAVFAIGAAFFIALPKSPAVIACLDSTSLHESINLMEPPPSSVKILLAAVIASVDSFGFNGLKVKDIIQVKSGYLIVT